MSQRAIWRRWGRCLRRKRQQQPKRGKTRERGRSRDRETARGSKAVIGSPTSRWSTRKRQRAQKPRRRRLLGDSHPLPLAAALVLRLLPQAASPLRTRAAKWGRHDFVDRVWSLWLRYRSFITQGLSALVYTWCARHLVCAVNSFRGSSPPIFGGWAA